MKQQLWLIQLRSLKVKRTRDIVRYAMLDYRIRQAARVAKRKRKKRQA